MNDTSRVVASLVGGLVPALVAFIVLLVVGAGMTSALTTAAIIGVGMVIFTWVRYDRKARR